MSASPLYRITFDDGTAVELRGNQSLWRVTMLGRLISLLVRDVITGDAIRQHPRDPDDPIRVVQSVERLPPRHAGGGGRRKESGQ